MQIADADSGTLIRYLRLYDGCSTAEKNSIFFLLLKNYTRSQEPGQTRDRLRAELAALLDAIHDPEAIPRLIRNIGATSDSTGDGALGRTTSLEDVVNAVNSAARQGHDPVHACMQLAHNMHQAGLCPLICYSFGRWHLSPAMTVREVRELIEFSVMSLYRVAKRAIEVGTDQLLLINTQGCNSDIYASHNMQRVHKIPKNMAAYEFLSKQEYDIAQFLEMTPLAPYLPACFAYDPASRAISRDMVDGMSGEHYLELGNGLTPQQIRALAGFYRRYRALGRITAPLDIHPGNFIWNEHSATWTLVDLGAIPSIGREYYEHERYADYYFHIWDQRIHNMAKYPIRSLDFAIDLDT